MLIELAPAAPTLGRESPDSEWTRIEKNIKTFFKKLKSTK